MKNAIIICLLFVFSPVHSMEDEELASIGQFINSRIEVDHYLKLSINDKRVQQRAFDEFIRSIDPFKRFFYQSDIERLRLQYGDRMWEQLMRIETGLVDESYAIFQRRVGQLEWVVSGVFSSPLFDYSGSDEFEDDEEKIDFVASDLEFAQRWRGFFKSSILSYYLHNYNRHISDEENWAKAFGDYAEISANQLEASKGKRPLDFVFKLFNSVLRALDGTSRYFPPVERVASEGPPPPPDFFGIGALLSEKDDGGGIEIREIVPGGPASREGHLQAGDLIISIEEGRENWR